MVALLVLALAITPQERYEELIKQYDAPLRTYLNDDPRAKTASEPFLKLARENPTDRISVEALHWVVKHTLFTPMAGEAMTLLAHDQIGSEPEQRVCDGADHHADGHHPARAERRHHPAGQRHRDQRPDCREQQGEAESALGGA